MKIAALYLIRVYQKYISPHKGYGCAHRIYNDGLSCSGYCAKSIKEKGFIAGVSAMPKRFRQCSLAAQKISLEKGYPDRKQKPEDDVHKACFIAEFLSHGCCFLFN